MKDTRKFIKAYSMVLFAVTLTAGFVEFLEGLTGKSILLFPADVFGGVILIVISSVFLRGVMHEECEAFFAFGSLMLAVFGVLYTLVFFADGLDAFITGSRWSALNNLRIEIALIPLAVPGLSVFQKYRKILPP